MTGESWESRQLAQAKRDFDNYEFKQAEKRIGKHNIKAWCRLRQKRMSFNPENGRTYIPGRYDNVK